MDQEELKLVELACNPRLFPIEPNLSWFCPVQKVPQMTFLIQTSTENMCKVYDTQWAYNCKCCFDYFSEQNIQIHCLYQSFLVLPQRQSFVSFDIFTYLPKQHKYIAKF